MNKRCYRLKFDHQRGMLVAVDETKRSHCKATGGTGDVERVTMPRVRALALGIAALLWNVSATDLAAAAIVADGKSGTQVSATANGTPLVNIVNPDARGLSRNGFAELNMSSPGMVVNNSLANGISRIGGAAMKNPQLTRQAKGILLESTGTSRSQLQGTVEVYGGKADVLIANPNGISVNGVTTLNASSLTLTTGVSRLLNDGSLRFDVNGGQIEVGAAGINTAGLNTLDMVARGITVQGPITAQEGVAPTDVQLIAGLNSYDPQMRQSAVLASSGANPPQYGISTTSAGSMYGNHVRLVATEAGVGVRAEGLIKTSQDLVISSNGDLSLAQADAGGAMHLSGSSASLGNGSSQGLAARSGALSGSFTGAVSVNGDIDAPSVALQAGSLTNNQHITSGAVLYIDTGTLTNAGQLYAATDANIALSSAGSLNTGSVVAGGNVSVARSENASVSVDLTNVPAGLIASDAGAVNVSVDTLRNDGTIYAAGPATVVTTSGLTNTGEVYGANTRVSAGSLTNTNNGAIVSKGDLTVSSAGDIHNTGGASLFAGGALSAAAGGILSNATGALIEGTGPTVQISAQQIVNDNATIYSTVGSLTLQATGLDNRNLGQLAGATDLSVHASQDVTNEGGAMMQARGQLTVTAMNLSNSGAQSVLAGNSVAVNVGAALSNADSAQILGQQLVNVNADSLSNDGNALMMAGAVDDTGQVAAAGSLQIHAHASMANTNGAMLASTGDAQVGAVSITNGAGSQVVGQDVTLNGPSLQNAGNIQAAGTLSANVVQLVNAGMGNLNARQIHLSATSGVQNEGTIGAGDQVSIDAASLANAATGQIGANNTIVLATDTYANTGRIRTPGDVTLTLKHGQDMVFNASQVAPLAGGTLTVNAHNVAFDIDTQNPGDVVVHATGDVVDNQSIISGGNLSIYADGNVTNAPNAAIWAARDVGIQGATILNQAGAQIQAGRDLRLAAGTVTNQVGRMAAARDLYIDADTLNNNSVLGGNNPGYSASSTESADSSYSTSGLTWRVESQVHISGLEQLQSTLTLRQGQLEAGGNVYLNQGGNAAVTDPGTPAGGFGRQPGRYGKGATVNNSGQIIAGSGNLLMNATVNNNVPSLTLSLMDRLLLPATIDLWAMQETAWGSWALSGSDAFKQTFGSVKAMLDYLLDGNNTHNYWGNYTVSSDQFMNTLAQASGSSPVLNGLLNAALGTDWKAQGYTTLVARWSALEANPSNAPGTQFLPNVQALLSAGGLVQHDGGAFNNGDPSSVHENRPTMATIAQYTVSTATGNFSAGVNYSNLAQTLDPSAVIKILTGNTHLFKINPVPQPASSTAPYTTVYPLYETSAVFVNQGDYYGTDYFLKSIGFNEAKTVAAIGDNYFVNQLVQQEVQSLTNGFLAGKYQAAGNDLVGELMYNAGLVTGPLGLLLGVAPTADQLAHLSKDIVWYVSETVNGQTALVPHVYLAADQSARATDASAVLRAQQDDATYQVNPAFDTAFSSVPSAGGDVVPADKSPVMVPLYQTTDSKIDQSQYSGTADFLKSVGANDMGAVAAVGDNYFVSQMITRELRQLSSAGQESAADLIKNAGAQALTLGLKVGVPPTSEQLAGLTQNIVWFNSETVNGKRVLIPVVYQAPKQGTVSEEKAQLQGGGAAVVGNQVSIRADKGGVSNVNGLIKANDGVTLKSDGDVINTADGGLSGGIHTDAGATQVLALGKVKGSGAYIEGDGTLVAGKQGVELSSGMGIDANGNVVVTNDGGVYAHPQDRLIAQVKTALEGGMALPAGANAAVLAQARQSIEADLVAQVVAGLQDNSKVVAPDYLKQKADKAGLGVGAVADIQKQAQDQFGRAHAAQNKALGGGVAWLEGGQQRTRPANVSDADVALVQAQINSQVSQAEALLKGGNSVLADTPSYIAQQAQAQYTADQVSGLAVGLMNGQAIPVGTPPELVTQARAAFEMAQVSALALTLEGNQLPPSWITVTPELTAKAHAQGKQDSGQAAGTAVTKAALDRAVQAQWDQDAKADQTYWDNLMKTDQKVASGKASIRSQTNGVTLTGVIVKGDEVAIDGGEAAVTTKTLNVVVSSFSSQHTDGVFSHSESTDTKSSASGLGVNVEAGADGKLSIKGKGITLNGGTYSGGVAELDAGGGDLSIATSQSYSYEKQASNSVGFVVGASIGAGDASASAQYSSLPGGTSAQASGSGNANAGGSLGNAQFGFQMQSSTDTDSAKTQTNANLNFKNSISLKSQKTVDIGGADLSTGDRGTIAITAAQVASTKYQNEDHQTLESSSTFVGIQAEQHSAIKKLADDITEQGQKQAAGQAKDGATGALQAGTYVGDATNLVFGDTYGASVSAAVNHQHESSSSQSTADNITHLNAGKISIQSTSGDIDLHGVKAQSAVLALDAAGSVHMQAAESSRSTTSETYNVGAQVTGNLSTNAVFRAAGAGVTVGVSGGNSKTTTRDTTYDNTELSAHNVSIKTGEDLALTGANVKADDVDLDVSGKMAIASLQDQHHTDTQSWSVNVSGGVTAAVNQTVDPVFGVAAPIQGSVGASASHSWEDSATTTQQSGIDANHTLTAKLKGDLDLTGGHLASKSGDGAVSVGGSVHAADVADHVDKDGNSGGANLGLAADGMLTAAVDYGKGDQVHTQSAQHGTIAVKDLAVSGTTSAALNRDAAELSTTLKDQHLAGSDISISAGVPTRTARKTGSYEPAAAEHRDSTPGEPVTLLGIKHGDETSPRAAPASQSLPMHPADAQVKVQGRSTYLLDANGKTTGKMVERQPDGTYVEIGLKGGGRDAPQLPESRVSGATQSKMQDRPKEVAATEVVVQADIHRAPAEGNSQIEDLSSPVLPKSSSEPHLSEMVERFESVEAMPVAYEGSSSTQPDPASLLGAYALDIPKSLRVLAKSTRLSRAYINSKTGGVNEHNGSGESLGHVSGFRAVELPSVDYLLTKQDAAKTLFDYARVSTEILSKGGDLLNKSEKENLEMLGRLSRMNGLQLLDDDSKSVHVLVNKSDKDAFLGGGVVYGVAIYEQVGNTANLEYIAAHPLTQVADGNKMRDALLTRISPTSEEGEALQRISKERNFRLRGVGKTLSAQSTAKMVYSRKINRVVMNAVNPRSGNIMLKYGGERTK